MTQDYHWQIVLPKFDGNLLLLANDPTPAAIPIVHLLDNYSKEPTGPHRRPLTLDTTIVKLHRIQWVLELLLQRRFLGCFALSLILYGCQS